MGGVDEGPERNRLGHRLGVRVDAKHGPSEVTTQTAPSPVRMLLPSSLCSSGTLPTKRLVVESIFQSDAGASTQIAPSRLPCGSASHWSHRFVRAEWSRYCVRLWVDLFDRGETRG